ncbi:MAG: FeoB-associated Cys-rich membrane protein [Bacillota bacterium]
MDKLIAFAILAASVYYIGRRLYRQIFLGEGCSSCDCGSGDSCCSSKNKK